jgi:sodium/proline symporter
VAGATLFETVFGLDYQLALTIGAILVISYTFLGGYLAVSWTDFFQGILMFCAIIIVPIAGLIQLGGFSNTLAVIKDMDPMVMNMFRETSGNSLAGMAIISSMAWGLGYFGQPHILVRFMGIRSADEIKKARVIAMIWVTLCLSAAVAVGVVGKGIITELADPETIFMTMVSMIFHPLVAGILLAAILAAVMSTADSQLLVTASAISEDFYKVLVRPKASNKELLLVSRLTVILVAIIAYVIASNPGNSVMGLVSYAWAGFGATFGPVIILSLYWKKMNRWGALSGLVLGGLTTIVFKSFDTALYEIVPGFLVAVFAVILVSLITGGADQGIEDKFSSVASKF